MRLDDFRNLVRVEFGDGLKHATPANVREFLDRLDASVLPEKVNHRIVIDEPSTSYEEVIKDFFSKILEMPPEQAMVALWLVSLDLAFASIEFQYSERFSSLFQDMDQTSL